MSAIICFRCALLSIYSPRFTVYLSSALCCLVYIHAVAIIEHTLRLAVSRTKLVGLLAI
ncbi:uncharacterized protein SCHCODRAFT_02354527 [Schizophyllum commune H4-8]|uniref:uncharacterized protein n=1 Tax=Schizophyllum commune (strain H4-8 / FGSC 9210) TaxID=578458 RepID=UPI00215F6AE4|nr:uncharacterized protein SCHCODRAFT_02354527 [Schizophyllum commune H4-8]KAI5890820.1 hypothetical protein SCHCODRAFT_02354527 [Schizophyllum commune H4-8]